MTVGDVGRGTAPGCRVMFYWAMMRESAKIYDKLISEYYPLYIWYGCIKIMTGDVAAMDKAIDRDDRHHLAYLQGTLIRDIMKDFIVIIIISFLASMYRTNGLQFTPLVIMCP